MKKTFINLLTTLLLLSSCAANKDDLLGLGDSNKLSVISPTGAPSLAFYNYKESGFEFETNESPNNIVSMMAGETKDVVVLPTNVGIQAIVNKKVNYKIAATITFGNFYMVSIGNDNDKTMNENDKIVLFSKNGVPDKVFHYIYGTQFDNQISYVETAADTAKAITTGSFINPDTGENETANYVMCAEPVLTNLLSKNPNVSLYQNMQEAYKNMSNGLELFQASIFINKKVSIKNGRMFLIGIQNDINYALENPQLILEKTKDDSTSKQLFGIDLNIASEVIRNNNRLGIGYKDARENKDSIDQFISLFNIGATNEEIYY